MKLQHEEKIELLQHLKMMPVHGTYLKISAVTFYLRRAQLSGLLRPRLGKPRDRPTTIEIFFSCDTFRSH